MILTLTASIMYWSLERQRAEDSEQSSVEDASSQKAPSSDGEDGSIAADSMSNLTVDDAASDTSSIAADSATASVENEGQKENILIWIIIAKGKEKKKKDPLFAMEITEQCSFVTCK